MHRILALATATLVLAGCSGGIGNVTTGSLFGSSSGSETAQATTGATPIVATAPAAPQSTPIARAMHVGAVTARAMKCGYNFDPTNLKTSYLASETALGTSVADVATLEKAYNVAFNGVNKVAATEAGFCSEKKTKEIKADLTRALGGDFNPPVKVAAPAEEEEGFFGGLFGGGSSSDKGPAYGSQEWWDKQAEKAGG